MEHSTDNGKSLMELDAETTPKSKPTGKFITNFIHNWLC